MNSKILCLAIKQNSFDTVKFLLENGTDPNIPEILVVDPLKLNTHCCNFAICKLLLEFGANPNTKKLQQ